MIHEVDESLRELARRDILSGANVEISFDAPTKDWTTRRNNPTLNLYLYDIREDLERRTVQFEEVRDDNGIVTERRLPPRKFRLSYLVTAWTQRPEDEHRLLSAALSCFVRFNALPSDILQGALVDQPEPVRITIGLPLPAERSISDVWTALGGELKPSLDLVVTVPIDTTRRQPVGPPVVEEPRLSVGAQDGAAEAAGGRRDRGTGPGRRAGVGAGERGGSDKERAKRRRGAEAMGTEHAGTEAEAAAAGAMQDDPDLAVETVHPGRGVPGRTLTTRTLPRR